MKAPTVNVVCKLLLKLNEEKEGEGLDNIPSKLFKMADKIVAPSLTQIFITSISTGISAEWKLARVTLISRMEKKGRPKEPSANIYHCDSRKHLQKYIYHHLYEYFTVKTY